MNKVIKSTRTKASKKIGGFELRKEHVLYEDGTTEDRTVYYTLDGKFIGSQQAKEAYLEELRLFKEYQTQQRASKKKVIEIPVKSEKPVQHDLDSEKSSEPIFPKVQRSPEPTEFQKKNKRSIDELGY